VPFVRVTRDKRGYEHVYLIDAPRGRDARLLYWYRTPPDVKVGREPFDEELKRTLEAQYPDVSFDWAKLSDIPTPPPDAQYWRERRRVERAARKARAEGAADLSAPEEADAEQENGTIGAEPATPHAIDRAVQETAPRSVEGAGGGTSPDAAGPQPARGAGRRRRRRGGRRRGVRSEAGTAQGQADPDQVSESTVSDEGEE
jgi:hypothetical protein